MTESESIRPDTSDMLAAHKLFRVSLASAPALVESAAGDDVRRALVANYYAQLLAFLEVHHDGEEEHLFPLLIERAPGDRETVDRAIEQHHQLVALLGAAKTSAAAWGVKGDSAGPDVVSNLGELEEFLSAHLDQEEETILPLATEHVTVEEWRMLARHSRANSSPGALLGLCLRLLLNIAP